MNPLAMLLPVYRLSTTGYLLALIGVALLDMARLRGALDWLLGGLPVLLVGYLVFTIHVNRRRYLGRSTSFAIVPLLLGWLMAGLGALAAWMRFVWPRMMDFLAEAGVDIEDPDAINAVIQEPGFAEAFLENAFADPGAEAAAQLMIGGGAYAGFWLVMIGFAIWFSQMKRLGGSVDPNTINRPQPAAPRAHPALGEGATASTTPVEVKSAETAPPAKPTAQAGTVTPQVVATDAGASQNTPPAASLKSDGNTTPMAASQVEDTTVAPKDAPLADDEEPSTIRRADLGSERE